ncbi:hypothetical protein GBAR_LOCUS31046 [Geodia barretti]|uniref:Secreted protein n=1 Tax=Geodia barretti TaxID=519541 RepID=A0AA35XFK4_GEOBA|nr:hypothetical protein GBAR_LOCUS31046 [Geodia barretti]
MCAVRPWHIDLLLISMAHNTKSGSSVRANGPTVADGSTITVLRVLIHITTFYQSHYNTTNSLHHAQGKAQLSPKAIFEHNIFLTRVV